MAEKKPWPELRGLRESVDASFADVDGKLGKSNYAARVERGELPRPNRATALELGEALRELGADTDGERLWLLAVREYADPDVRAFFESEQAELRAGLARALPELSETERRVIEGFRRAAEYIPVGYPVHLAVAEALDAALDAASAKPSPNPGASDIPPSVAVQIFLLNQTLERLARLAMKS